MKYYIGKSIIVAIKSMMPPKVPRHSDIDRERLRKNAVAAVLMRSATIALLAVLLMAVDGFALDPQTILTMWGGGYDYSDLSSRVEIRISGSTAELENQIIPINIHYGSQQGDYTNRDIYCGGNCKTDFSDVRFTLADGTELEHWRASYGNWEFIPDSTLAYNTIIDSSGNLWAASPVSGKVGLCKSTDNGATWTVKDADASGLVYVADNGDVFTSRAGGTIYRSAAANDGGSPSLVLTLDSGASILRFAASEDSAGRIFFGQYQEEMLATIYRSTDNGATFDIVLRVPAAGSGDAVVGSTVEKGSLQHFHGLSVDPFTDYIYAGADSSGGATAPGVSVMRSVDHGVTWTPIWSDDAADAMGFAFYDGHRLFGGEAGSEKAIVLTDDDETYTTVVGRGTFGMLAKSGDYVVGGGSTAGTGYRYPQLFISPDQGATFSTAFQAEYDGGSGFSSGYEYGGGYAEARTPTGDDPQILMGADLGGGAAGTYHDGRFYAGQAGRHQSQFYVKIPTVPTTGQTIYAYFGNAKVKTDSDPSQLYTREVALDGLTTRWKCDDGSGTTLADSVGDADATITGVGWSGRSVSEYSRGRLPYYRLPGNSLDFDGTGYVDAQVDTALDLAKNFSVTFWIEREDIGEIEAVLSKGDYSANNGWLIGTEGQADNPSLVFAYSNGSANADLNPTTQLRIGQAMLCAVVVDNASPANIKFGINGQLFDAQALSYDPISGTGTVVIGAKGDAGRSNKLTAKVDDIRIYKGKQLSQTEFREIYEHRDIVAESEPAVAMIGLTETVGATKYPRVDRTKITGDTWYVAKYSINGDGTTDAPALSVGGPGAFNTIAAAVAAASSGDGIIVLPGTYTELVDTGAKNLAIMSTGGVAQTIITGSDARRCVQYINGQTSASFFDGFTLTHGAGATGNGLCLINSSPTIGHVKIRDCSSATAGAKGAGLYADGSNSIVKNADISNNLTPAASGLGGNIYLKASCAMQFENLTTYGGQAAAGGNIYDYSATTSYKNVIDWGANVVSNFSTAPAGDRMTYSNVQKATGVYTGTGNLNTDPLFTNTATGDLTLQAGSPSKNTGTAATTTDILDNPIVGTRDMGAYEVQ